MPVLKNIGVLATCNEAGAQGDIHSILNAALVWEDKKISWVGPERSLPKEYLTIETINAEGRLVVPGLIDCHTHLAFGGWREDEFERRILGETYLEIAKKGGGILSTVRKTREASESELLLRSLDLLSHIAKLGVTTIECKSGYGLTVKDELKLLNVYRELSKRQPLSVVATFLGAHVVPLEFLDNRKEYLRLLTEELIPQVGNEKLAEFCDIFLEEAAFSKSEAKEILEAGKRYGLRPKLHVDQLQDGVGGVFAAEMGAISADHLEYTNEKSAEAMAAADVVGVLLPLATLYTHQKPANARMLMTKGVKLAVATDFNPGSAPSYDLPLAMMLACNLNRMTPREVLKGVTIYAAKAINREESIGSLEVGKSADFAIIDATDVNEWLYHFRPNVCVQTVKGGVEI